MLRSERRGRRRVIMALKRIIVVAMVGILLALVLAAMARLQHGRITLHSLSVEPSGIYDQAGAELPFVTLTLSIPGLEQPAIEFSQEPFEVECNINDGWIRIENRATVSRGIQNEMSFLTLPGAEMCRLRFKYQREGLVWRVLRTIVPRGAPYHQFSNRFSQWVWLKNPFGPKLLTVMRRSHFRRPPHWTQVTAEIRIPRPLANGEPGLQEPSAPKEPRAAPDKETRRSP